MSINIYLSKKLNDIYLSGQTFNHTAKYIIDFLSKDDPISARSEFYYDGDKIPGYIKWGREFRKLLHEELGCRLHGVRNCDRPFCKIQ